MQTMFGYYTNRFVRTSAGWKIRACKLTLSWQTGNPQIFTLAARASKPRKHQRKVSQLSFARWRNRCRST